MDEFIHSSTGDEYIPCMFPSYEELSRQPKTAAVLNNLDLFNSACEKGSVVAAYNLGKLTPAMKAAAKNGDTLAQFFCARLRGEQTGHINHFLAQWRQWQNSHDVNALKRSADMGYYLAQWTLWKINEDVSYAMKAAMQGYRPATEDVLHYLYKHERHEDAKMVLRENPYILKVLKEDHVHLTGVGLPARWLLDIRHERLRHLYVLNATDTEPVLAAYASVLQTLTLNPGGLVQLGDEFKQLYDLHLSKTAMVKDIPSSLIWLSLSSSKCSLQLQRPCLSLVILYVNTLDEAMASNIVRYLPNLLNLRVQTLKSGKLGDSKQKAIGKLGDLKHLETFACENAGVSLQEAICYGLPKLTKLELPTGEDIGFIKERSNRTITHLSGGGCTSNIMQPLTHLCLDTGSKMSGSTCDKLQELEITISGPSTLFYFIQQIDKHPTLRVLTVTYNGLYWPHIFNRHFRGKVLKQFSISGGLSDAFAETIDPFIQNTTLTSCKFAHEELFPERVKAYENCQANWCRVAIDLCNRRVGGALVDNAQHLTDNTILNMANLPKPTQRTSLHTFLFTKFARSIINANVFVARGNRKRKLANVN